MAATVLCPQCAGEVPSDAPEGLCPRCLLQSGLGVDEAPRSTPGISWVAPTPAQLAPLFPQLEILRLLGQGGMGAVYQARQLKLDRLVALKVLPPQAGRDPAFAERFAREARALARLNHPHIVGVHDFGESGGYFFFVMEYVDGFDLRQWLAARHLGHPGPADIVMQACDALQYAHDESIVHRDIKPENILLTRKGEVKIADFGLAKLLGGAASDWRLTATHQVMGTPHYMAPEQMERPQSVDHRADVYSLGVVFYEMLTGELPLGRFAAPSQRAPIQPGIDAIVLRTLEKDPDRRYAQVRDLKTDLQALSSIPAGAISPADPMFQREVEKELFRLSLKGPAIGLAITGLLGLAFWAIVAMVLYEDLSNDVNNYYRQLSSFTVPDAKDLYRVNTYQNLENQYNYYSTSLTRLGRVVFLAGPLVLAAAGLLWIAARRMLILRGYELAVLGAVWAMVPWSGPVVLLGFPVGMWALRVLLRHDIKLAFIHHAVHERMGRTGLPPAVPALAPSPPTGPGRRKVRSILGAAYSLMVGSRVDKG